MISRPSARKFEASAVIAFVCDGFTAESFDDRIPMVRLSLISVRKPIAAPL